MIAIFTPLVSVATMVFSVYIPQTRGFFNIGETMVYTTALLFGPFIGSFAGGVGSMLADLLLGVWYYAPATLVIKGLEGGFVGFFGSLRPKLTSKLWKIFTFSIGLIVGILLGGIGSLYYSGTVELRLGIPPPENPNLIFTIPPEFWYILGVSVALLITLAGFVLRPDFGWLVFTLLIGGTIMVTGYFLYQKFLLFPLFGIETIAEAEIPFNIAQMLIGLIVAVPIATIVWRSLPQLKS
jgi:uncharacterized membrane protein